MDGADDPSSSRSPGKTARDGSLIAKLILYGAFAFLLVGGVVMYFVVTSPSNTDELTIAISSDPKVTETAKRLKVVAAQLDVWYRRYMSYPDDMEPMVRDGLVQPKQLDDAWGQRMDYSLQDDLHFRLCSRGKDNLPKTLDDVCEEGRP